MTKTLTLLTAISAFTAVAMGAFGAHGLKSKIPADLMVVYQTAVDYHMWHALGLGLLAGFALHTPDSALLRWAGWFMLAGIVLFSGSLYVLAISGIKGLGAITPFGGLAFLIAWGLFATYAVKSL